MSHQDRKGVDSALCFGQQLHEVIRWLIRPNAFADIRFRKDCSWSAWSLAAAAMLWAWAGDPTLIERFRSVRQIIQNAFGLQRELATSFQAFSKMLLRWTTRLKQRVSAALRERMRQRFPHQRVAGWTIVGVDGSRVELPRTESNQAGYCPLSMLGIRRRRRTSRSTKAGRSKAANPQMWITTVWCCTAGLPWDWRTGRSDSSERAHLLEMIPELPNEALVTADAGFIGYDYWSALLEAGHPFVIRVGSNVKLLKRLGYARESHGLVYLWPDAVAAKGRPPLVLRLVVVQGGKHPVYLVTSVLSSRALSERSVAEIYSLRWGIEVYYRSFKQTFARRKLRSHKAEHAQVELDWAMAGLWAACLYAQRRGHVPPRRLSVATVLRVFRHTMQYALPRDPKVTLADQFKRAVLDEYVRKNKTSREYPRKKKERPAGKPQILVANANQVRLARNLKQQTKRLTA